MRAKEFIFEVSLENLARTPIKGGITLGDAVAAKMAKEGAIQDVKDVSGALDLLSAADPTNANNMTKWLARIYLSPESNFKVPEDVNQIKQDLAGYSKLVKRGVMDEADRDLNKIKTLRQLYAVIDKYNSNSPDIDDDHDENKLTPEEKDITVIIDDGKFSVITTNTFEANTYWGGKMNGRYQKRTKWCTGPGADGNRSYFDEYTADGPLYVIFAGNRRFQFHYESDQFLDENDADLTKEDIALLSAYPGWAKFLNMQIEKHYGKYFEAAKDNE